MLNSSFLSLPALSQILGLSPVVPMTPDDMAKCLCATFYPNAGVSPTVDTFIQNLQSVLLAAGVSVISYEEALARGRDGCVGEGIVLFAPGSGEIGNLAIDHVSSLSKNTVVGILDGTQGGLRDNHFQRRVDALVSALVWHMVHVLIYVDDESWTVCNMNGAIDTFGLRNLEQGVRKSLIPKLAAPVLPPNKGDFDIERDAFSPSSPENQTVVQDLLTGALVWRKTGLLATQTKLEKLEYRSNRYKRIASAYLNWRTGMSYGFLARQLPSRFAPALRLDEADPMLQRLDWEEKDFMDIDGAVLVSPKFGEQRYLLRIPEVSVLCTRSGCEKTNIDPANDLTTLTLRRGRVIVGMPTGLPPGSDCQPSFDTITIVSHAVGNVIIASLLDRLAPGCKFAAALRHKGLALAHWHGYMDDGVLPPGYYLHGDSNPPVSCSTPQAALYSILGKFAAFQASIFAGIEFLGDAHLEPSHGTNLTGLSLSELALMVNRA